MIADHVNFKCRFIPVNHVASNVPVQIECQCLRSGEIASSARIYWKYPVRTALLGRMTSQKRATFRKPSLCRLGIW